MIADRSLRGLLWLAKWPSPRLAWWLSRAAARLIYVLRTDAYHITRVNIERCFPQLDKAQRKALIRERLAHMCMLVFEFAHLKYWPSERLLRQINKEIGVELLIDAHNSERGVLLLVPHFGNWELLCAYLGVNLSVAALYGPPKISGFEAAIRETRQRFSGELFPISAGGMRSLLKVLRRGGLVAVLPDQVPGRDSGIDAAFFGSPALTMTLPHRLAQRQDPLVFMGSVERHWNGQAFDYHFRVEPLDDLDVSDELNFVTQVNAYVERIARRAPAQYQWEYKRFKRSSEDVGRVLYRRKKKD